MKQTTAVIYLLTTALLWSIGGLLIKLVDWNPMAIAGARSALAAVVIGIAIRRPRFTWSAAQIGAAVAYAATVILFVTATKLTTAANAILLQYTAPIYVALFSGWFLAERIRRIDWAAALVTLAGMVLFFLEKLTTTGFWGNICAILSAVTFAWVALLLRKQKAGSPVESILLGNVLAVLASIPFMFGSWPPASAWGYLVLLGVFQLGLSYLLYARAIKHVPAFEAILILVIEPILNPLWVLLWSGEAPSVNAMIGGAVVVGAVIVRGLLRNSSA